MDYARKLLMVRPALRLCGWGCWLNTGVGRVREACGGMAEAGVGDHPKLIGPLARRYDDEPGRTEEADGLLKTLTSSSAPGPRAYRSLADRAKGRGDLVRWKSILDDYLDKEEDHGLDHAKVRVEVAEFLMSKGFTGERAAVCARPRPRPGPVGPCNRPAPREGQEDWEAAEKWVRNRAGDTRVFSAYDLVDFCVRTGGEGICRRPATSPSWFWIARMTNDDRWIRLC